MSDDVKHKPSPVHPDGVTPICHPACGCWCEGEKPWCGVTDLNVHHGTVCGPAMTALRDENATIRARLAEVERDRNTWHTRATAHETAKDAAELAVRTAESRLAEVERERDDAKHCMTRALDERDAADARTREAWANLSTAESARDAAQERVAALEAERDAERRKAEAAQTAAYRVLGCADAECDGCDKAGNCEYRSAEASALGNIIVADDAMERVSKAIQVLAEPLSLTESVRLIASARGVRITRALAILRGEV